MPVAALRPYHWFDIGGISLKDLADKKKKYHEEAPEKALIFERLIERHREREGIIIAIASLLLDD